jgi:UPF0271 protein
MLTRIDLNCDMGEGFATDEEIMPFISSANIACGGHAGDEGTIRKTIALAIKHNVAIGAHPSYPDREGFGRMEMKLPLDEIFELMIEQISLVKFIAEDMGAKLHHVKTHGALYNTAAKDPILSQTIAKAIQFVDKKLPVYGLPNSWSEKAALDCGLEFYGEFFSDRTYTDDGSLTPRTEKNAMVSSADAALHQVLQVIIEGTVKSISGKTIPLKADTICIHGDGLHAVEFAKVIREGLENNHINIGSAK